MPLFTVLIPTHDHGATLLYSVGSIQAQTVQDFEIFIVGDGVSDRTRDLIVAMCMQDCRIRFFDNPKGPRHGEAHRHCALQEARGQLVSYQADDDLWLPDHLEKMTDLLAQNDLVHTLQLVVDPSGVVSPLPFHLAGSGQLVAMRQNVAGFGLASAGHTLAAYHRLPHGWRAAPPNVATDLYMWLQFLDQPWCRAASSLRPTVVHFSSRLRRSATPGERLAELACWAARLSKPECRQEIVLSALEPLCTNLFLDTLRERGRQESLSRPYAPGTLLEFKPGSPGSDYLTHGFWPPESWGAWSMDRSAAIVLPLAKPIEMDLMLRLNWKALLEPRRLPSVRLRLSVNGTRLGEWKVDTCDPQEVETPRLPRQSLAGADSLFVQFQIDRPARPVDLGINEDTRSLGVGLISLQVAA